MNSLHWNRAIIRHCHRRHAWALRVLVVLYTCSVWILGFAIHPGWLLGIGLLSAIGLALVLADADARDGVDELMAALPMHRWRQHLLRWLYGLIPLALLSMGAVLVYAWDLHQAFWQLFGLTLYTVTREASISQSTLAHLAGWSPLLIYTHLYALYILCPHRRNNIAIAVAGLMGLGMLVGLAFWMEHQNNLALQGRYILLLWALSTFFTVFLSIHKVVRGDSLQGMSSRRVRTHYLAWLLITLLAIVLLVLFSDFVLWVTASHDDIRMRNSLISPDHQPYYQETH